MRILCVEDEPSILDAIEMALQQDGHEVVLARSGREALEAFRAEPPDLVVLDRMLPDGDGLSVCVEIRRVSELPILMLTALGELEDRVEGLDQGADDYLVKPFRVKELQARVRALGRRTNRGNDRWLSVGHLRLSLERREAFHNDRLLELTTREFDLLAYFLSHPGRVFSKEQLLESVWGWQDELNPNVVQVYVSSLRQKLGSKEVLRTVRGVGYALG